MIETLSLEALIDHYDRIFLFDDTNKLIQKLMCDVLLYVRKNEITNNVLVMGITKLDGEKNYIQISKLQSEEIIQKYRMYEFTDRLRIVSITMQYGTMLNYLSTGVLTEREYIEALLH